MTTNVISSEQGNEPLSFQEIILRLQQYWADQGCVVLQPYDNEVGAGTFHTATTLRRENTSNPTRSNRLRS